MGGEKFSWCEVFVDAVSEAQALEEARRFFGVADDAGRFALPVAEVEVRHAQEWPSHPDNVEGWRARVEIDARPRTTDEEMLAFVSGLMAMFRSHGHRVVADSDFPGLPQQDFDDIAARGWPSAEQVVLNRTRDGDDDPRTAGPGRAGG